MVVLNEAGIGKDYGGRGGVGLVAAQGVPCATVGHNSARIGDAADMWESGVVSRVNEAAAALGLAPGQELRAALEGLVRGR